MVSYRKILIGALSTLASFSYSHALPPAGTIIGNAATATYYDENNNQYTTTSNVVQTVVQAVCGVDVLPNDVVRKEGVPGQTVYLPFQIKNTGNKEYTYNLSITNGTFTPKDIYLDENQNGVVDPGEQKITSITLGMEEIKSVIVAVKIPTDANPSDTDTFQLQATSTEDTNCYDNDGSISGETGEITVVNDAVLILNKSVDKSTAVPGDTLTYTISFKNVGTKDALSKDGFNVDIDNDGTVDSDIEGILLLDQIPSGATYIKGSTQGTPTSNPAGFVVYSEDGVSWYKDENKPKDVNFIGFFIPDSNPQDNNLEAVLSPDQQGILTFKVMVNNPFDDADSSVDNKANIIYKTSQQVDKTTNSNETHTTIPASAQADILLGGFNNPEEDNDTNWQDDNTAENVPAGSWVVFKHTAKNNGNIEDTINLHILDAETNLPEGAIVEFWNSDMSAKLIDTDGDGNVDIGALDAGITRDFVVKVFIPARTPSVSKDGNIDYYLTVEAISHNNPSEKDKSRDNIDGIVGASVDLGKWNTVADNQNFPSDNDTDGTNDSDDILPSDNGREIKIITDNERCSATVKNIVNPGETAVYPIEILNRGAYADSFSLSAKGYVGDVKFYIDENCDGTLDREITNTPLIGGTVLSQTITAGTNELPVEDVSSFQPGDIVYIGSERKEIQQVDVENKKLVLTSGVTSGYSKGVFVSEAVYLVMKVEIPDNQPPGEHNIVIEATSKNSNARDSIDAYLKVNSIDKIVITPDGSDQLPPGGTTTYQHIITNKGNSPENLKVVLPSNTKLTYIILDNDQNPQGTQFNLPTLNPDDTYVIYIKAIAPSDISPGTVETLEVKVVDASNDQKVYDTAQDTTTVIEGFIQLTKSADKTQAKPGDVITYTIKYKNIGDRNALNVVITDNIPNYTQYEENSLCIDNNCDGTCDKGLTDTAGDDEGEYDQTNNLVRFRVGTGADKDNGGTVAPGEEGCIIFKVKIKE